MAKQEKNNLNEYGNGLLKSIEQMIYWVNSQIEKIKSQPLQKNTPRQITDDGKLKAYYNTRNKLEAKKKSIIKNS